MSTATKLLIGALVLQIALIVAQATRSSGGAVSTAKEGAPILPGIDAKQVARIAIADQQGTSIELARGAEGFVVASAADYPTKADAVTKLLDKFLGLRSAGVAATSARSHAGLEVAEGRAQRDVRLFAADGKELARLFIGRAVAGGTFVRRAGSDEVERVDETITYEVSTAPATYIDTQLISFDPAQAQSLTIARAAEGTIELERGEGDAWKAVKPLPFDAAKDKVDQVLRSASRVYFTKPATRTAAPEHGFDPAPPLSVEVKLKDGTAHRLEVGAKVPGQSTRYARKGGGEFVVEIGEYTAAAFEKDAGFFHPAPPAPPAAGTAPPGAVAPPMPHPSPPHPVPAPPKAPGGAGQ